MILDILPLLEGWEPLLLEGKLTIQPNTTKYIALPNCGLITSAMFTTTSKYTQFSIGGGNTISPQYLSELGLYKQNPICLTTLNPPYVIIINPSHPIPYNTSSRLQIQGGEDLSITTYVLEGIEITDKKALIKSIDEVISNDSLKHIILNFLQGGG